MGASSETPVLHLPQWEDTDKPTWRGDLNAAFLAIDEAINAKADKATLDYYVKDYGGIGDGVTDDTAHIQAAIDAATTAGGGNVHLMRNSTHLVSSEVIVKNNVKLIGDHSQFNQGIGAVNKPNIKFSTVNSRIRVGVWAGTHGFTDTQSPVGLANLVIDANSQGPLANTSDGAVYMAGTAIDMDTLHIANAQGNGLYLDGVQNSQFTGVDVFTCDVGIVLDNGAGGLLFDRSEVSTNQTGLLVTDDLSMGNAYPFGSAHVAFNHCIFENNAPARIEVDIRVGTITFVECGFSNNVGATPLTGGTLVKISNPIYAGIASFGIFDSCIFVMGTGLENAVTINGNNQFYMYGQNYLQGKSGVALPGNTPFKQDGGIGIGQIDGNVYKLNINQMAIAVNSGSLINWFVTRSGPTQFSIDPTLGSIAQVFKQTTDAGFRLAISATGAILLYDGTNFTQIGSVSLEPTTKRNFYFNPTNGHVFQGAVEFLNALTLDQSIIVGTTLSVNGATTLTGKLTTLGDAEITSNLTVDGNATLKGGTTHQGAVVNQAATTTTGTATFNGGTVSNGLVTRNAGEVEQETLVIPNGAVVVDCAVTRNIIYNMTSTANITGWTINNKVVGSRLRIIFVVGAGGPYAVVWPAFILGKGKTAPPTSLVASATDGLYILDLIYIGTSWYEIGRNF